MLQRELIAGEKGVSTGAFIQELYRFKVFKIASTGQKSTSGT